ncbi:RNA-directed DNA polymerase [Rheinheimera riviphila]|uniref:RNA-directed DNA polymerase n=1 Tax=Rheinheimera riviphila TaxID=1834037 RepID=A0A437QBQ2_9GAMM|nr:antiviral reverse transcriptase Drt3b [Rheinheimera riviphila]RVU31974.1 RNA-directed DNA polymerase [Rheinheimera riviphila]
MNTHALALGYRYISIPHPSSQIAMKDLIFDYSDLITNLCSKSNFSIRKPTGIASYYYQGTILNELDESKFSDGDVVQETSEQEDSDDLFKAYGCSFFSYSGYTLLYKFFDSLEFQSLEKKFSYMFRFDIEKCFDSIYTHSIGWAIKGKDFSKENIGKKTFDSDFDAKIRSMNDDETNGIVIGPEFSRVFAEIILQAIDCKVENELLKENKFRGTDYTIKRYVDDYFVFTRDENLARYIYDKFRTELRNYKLFVNESKESVVSRPFITNLSIAKTEVSDALDHFFSSIKRDKSSIDSRIAKKEIPSLIYIYKPYTRSKILINRFKSSVRSNNADYSSFSGLVMTIIRSRLSKIQSEMAHIKNIRDHDSVYRNFITVIIDFTSFLYCMSPKVRSSFLFSQILILVKKVSEALSPLSKSEIHKKIKDETSIILNNLTSPDVPKIEIINFLLCLKLEFGNYVLSEQQIVDFFGVSNNDVSGLDYFEMISALYMLCMDGQNLLLRDAIYDKLECLITESKSPETKTELILMFFDLASFPHANNAKIESSFKLLYSKVKGIQPKPAAVSECLNYLKANPFFTDWSGKLSIERILLRKEAQAGYHF